MNMILGLRTEKSVPCTIKVPGPGTAKNLDPRPEETELGREPRPEKTETGRDRRRTLGPWVPASFRQVCKAITLQSQ